MVAGLGVATLAAAWAMVGRRRPGPEGLDGPEALAIREMLRAHAEAGARVGPPDAKGGAR